MPGGSKKKTDKIAFTPPKSILPPAGTKRDSPAIPAASIPPAEEPRKDEGTLVGQERTKANESSLASNLRMFAIALAGAAAIALGMQLWMFI